MILDTKAKPKPYPNNPPYRVGYLFNVIVTVVPKFN